MGSLLIRSLNRTGFCNCQKALANLRNVIRFDTFAASDIILSRLFSEICCILDIFTN